MTRYRTDAPKEFWPRAVIGGASLALLLVAFIAIWNIWSSPVLDDDYEWNQRFETWFSMASVVGAFFVVCWWRFSPKGTTAVLLSSVAAAGAIWQIWPLAGGALLASLIFDALDSNGSIFK
jgi:hypothetical protein